MITGNVLFQVFTEVAGQGHIFEEIMGSPLDAFLQAKHGLFIAYGPTASGKTHTAVGPSTDPGIVPRTLERLFRLLGSQVPHRLSRIVSRDLRLFGALEYKTERYLITLNAQMEEPHLKVYHEINAVVSKLRRNVAP